MKAAYSDYIIDEICGTDENATLTGNPQQIINVAAIASSFLDNLDDSKEETPEPAELKTKNVWNCTSNKC
uniref:Uncharacterized protein n=1 Tax=Panagrolaimus sp. ES5 TaxID=591445 RepID=A0AC34FA91_9BILA